MLNKRFFSTTTATISPVSVQTSTLIKKKILVFGLSVEGLATSLCLKMKNIHCDIVEHDRDLSKFNGRSLLLPQNTTKILHELNLLEEVEKNGKVIHDHKMRTQTGNTLVHSVWKKTYPFIGISEKILIQILLDKYTSLPNGRIIMNDNVKFSENSNKKWDCSFRKSSIKFQYDALIGAEGVDSKLRKDLFKNNLQSRKIEKVSTILKVPSYMDYQDKSNEWWGGVSRLLVYPISNETVAVESYSYFPYISGRMNKTKNLSGQFQKIHNQWSGVGVENILAEISQSKLARDSLLTYDLEVLYDNIIDDFVTHNAALVGEAAHSIDPSAFQKPTVAFEDAFTLAKCLSENESIEASLKEYQRLRKYEPRIYNELSLAISKEFTIQTGKVKKFIRILRFLLYKKWWMMFRLSRIFNRNSFK
jgi:salicylate hydroxylase